jgi:hypothetical protein
MCGARLWLIVVVIVIVMINILIDVTVLWLASIIKHYNQPSVFVLLCILVAVTLLGVLDSLET